jgi:hypothetical protein
VPQEWIAFRLKDPITTAKQNPAAYSVDLVPDHGYVGSYVASVRDHINDWQIGRRSAGIFNGGLRKLKPSQRGPKPATT